MLNLEFDTIKMMCLTCITDKLPMPLYCERGNGNGLLVEPLTTFTNVTFFITAFLAHLFIKKSQIKNKGISILPWMLAIVGLGSILFHTARNSITLLFDVLPIYIFIIYSLYLILKELIKNKLVIIFILLAYAASQIFLTSYLPKEFLNGSFRHLTTISFFIIIGLSIVNKYGNKLFSTLLAVFILYGTAIFLRSIDLWSCQFFPLGTHFLWHILAASAGYFIIVLIVKMKTLQK